MCTILLALSSKQCSALHGLDPSTENEKLPARCLLLSARNHESWRKIKEAVDAEMVDSIMSSLEHGQSFRAFSFLIFHEILSSPLLMDQPYHEQTIGVLGDLCESE